MHHFVTEICTRVHISVTKWCILGYLSNALWDLWDGSIDSWEMFTALAQTHDESSACEITLDDLDRCSMVIYFKNSFCGIHADMIYNHTPAQRSCWGGGGGGGGGGGRWVYWFPSVRPSVRPAFRVRSVAPTVLIGSISYLYILSSNCRRCVACKVSCKNLNFWQFSKFVTLILSCFDLESDVNH